MLFNGDAIFAILAIDVETQNLELCTLPTVLAPKWPCLGKAQTTKVGRGVGNRHIFLSYFSHEIYGYFGN